MASPTRGQHNPGVRVGLQGGSESIRPHEKRALGAQLNVATLAEINGVGMEHAVEVEEKNHGVVIANGR
jgi:hypothetical protein